VRYTHQHRVATLEFEVLQRVLTVPTVQTLYLEQTFAAPVNAIEGQLLFADGVVWNPGGTGKGIYAYYGGAWVKL